MSASLAVRKIALEANMASNAVNALKSFLPEIFEETKNLFDSPDTAKDIKISVPANINFIKKEIQHYGWDKIRDLKFNAPEGFSGNLIEYSVLLHQILHDFRTVSNETLEPLNLLLARIISDADFRKSSRFDFKLIDALRAKREEKIKQLNKFVNTSSTNTLLSIKNVLDRNSDILLLLDKTYALSMDSGMIGIDKIKQECKDCTDRINLLIENIQDKSIDSISPELAKYISGLIHETALEMEFIALVFFKLMSFAQSVESMTNNIEKFIKMK